MRSDDPQITRRFSMASKQAFFKAIPILVAACFVGVASSAIAAEKSAQADQPKVDCKKYPEHQECKGKN
jgi:hypothetical protein